MCVGFWLIGRLAASPTFTKMMSSSWRHRVGGGTANQRCVSVNLGIVQIDAVNVKCVKRNIGSIYIYFF